MSLSIFSSSCRTSSRSIISSSGAVLTYREIFRLYPFFSISSIETRREYFLSSSFRYWYVLMILSICSSKSVFWRFPFSKYSLALIISTSSYFLHFLRTRIHTGIPVEKNRFAGNPMTASIFPSLRSFVLIFSSAPPRNSTPCGRIIAIVPSSLRKWNPCNKKAKSAADFGASP